MEGEYFKLDCADTCPYPRRILKVIRSRASRIQTYNISLALLVLLVYQRMQFSRLGIPNDVQLNSNLFDDS